MTLPEILKQFDELFEEYGAKQAFTQTYTSMVMAEVERLEGIKKDMPTIIRQPFELAESVGKKMFIDEEINYWKNKLK